MLESMGLDRQIGEVEKDLNVLEKKTHELSLSIENRGGAEDSEFATRMGERKALLDQKTELLDKRDGLRDQRQTAWAKEEELGAIAIAAKVEIPSERWTPELKELREVAQKISIMDYFRAAEEGRPANGAAGEYNTHIFGSNRAGDFPIEMLHDRDALIKFNPGDWDDIKESENRAAITGTNHNPGASVNYVSQLFATTEAAFCGASFPAVGVGDHSFPIFSKPTTAGHFARDAEEGDPGGSLTINTAVNQRIQGSMELNAEDENRIPNIAGGLVANLRASLMEQLDSYAIAQLLAGLAAVAINSGTTVTLPAFLASIGAMVDGYAARNVGDVRGLLNAVPETPGTTTVTLFSRLSGLTLSGGGSHFSELPRLSDPNYFRGSAHLPNVTAGDTAFAIMTKTALGLSLGRFQVPIWRRGSMLRDTGVGQRRGRVLYTVATFAAVEVTATDQHMQLTFDVA